MIKAIIFDFFDVFRTDAYKAWVTKNNFANAQEYFDIARQQDLGEITTEQFLTKVSDLTGRDVTVAEIDENASMDNEVVKIAQSLKSSYKIGLLSNAPSKFIRNLLVTHELEQHFHHIVISSEVGMVKPSAEIFHHILQKLEVQPGEAIFIDDNIKHVEAATKVGLKSIQFTSAKKLHKDLQGILPMPKHL